MIEVKVKPCIAPNGKDASEISCHIEGNLKLIIAETAEAIQAIYRGLADENPDPIPLLMFRHRIMAAVCDPHSPLWDLKDENVMHLNGEAGKEDQPC